MRRTLSDRSASRCSWRRGITSGSLGRVLALYTKAWLLVVPLDCPNCIVRRGIEPDGYCRKDDKRGYKYRRNGPQKREEEPDDEPCAESDGDEDDVCCGRQNGCHVLEKWRKGEVGSSRIQLRKLCERKMNIKCSLKSTVGRLAPEPTRVQRPPSNKHGGTEGMMHAPRRTSEVAGENFLPGCVPRGLHFLKKIGKSSVRPRLDKFCASSVRGHFDSNHSCGAIFSLRHDQR